MPELARYSSIPGAAAPMLGPTRTRYAHGTNSLRDRNENDTHDLLDVRLRRMTFGLGAGDDRQGATHANRERIRATTGGAYQLAYAMFCCSRSCVRWQWN